MPGRNVGASSLQRQDDLLVLALSAFGQSTDARVASEPAPLSVDIRDYAIVPRTHMTRALAQLNAILDSAGIRSVCRIQRRSTSDKWSSEPMSDKVITVHIFPELMDDRFVANTDVLGVVPGAPSGGRLVYLFSSRVEVIARRHATDYGTLLGTLLAHEIGHVLLPGTPHSHVGLMRPLCDGKQIRNMMLGTLAFTPAQAADIKSRLF